MCNRVAKPVFAGIWRSDSLYSSTITGCWVCRVWRRSMLAFYTAYFICFSSLCLFCVQRMFLCEQNTTILVFLSFFLWFSLKSHLVMSIEGETILNLSIYRAVHVSLHRHQYFCPQRFSPSWSIIEHTGLGISTAFIRTAYQQCCRWCGWFADQ